MEIATVIDVLLDRLTIAVRAHGQDNVRLWELEEKLREANARLWELEEKLGDPPHPKQAEDALALVDALARKQRIEAIKALRTMTGLGLKEAKDQIERILPMPELPG